jgi:hypothetical protein
MAKELYVGKNLTNEMITVGKQFLQQIEAVMPITASFWLYTSEAEVWRLHLVTPLMATRGPRKVYDKVLNVLDADQEHEYSLPAVCLYATDDNDQYVSSLRMMRLSHEVSEKRFTSLGVNGRYIEDAYIYRLYEAKADK